MRRLLVVLGALAVLLASAGPASAAAPLEVEAPLTDQVGAIGGADRAAVTAALSALPEQTDVSLFVVFVSGFDASSGVDWAEETATLSRLGAADVLLAVDVSVDAYEWWIAEDSELSAADVEQLMADVVQPRLAGADYSGAVLDLAQGLGLEPDDERAVSSWSTTTTALVVMAVAGVLGGAHLLSRRRPTGTPTR